MMGETVWAWLGFNLFVLALLALDLGVLHRKDREIKIGEALWLSLFYIVLALLFAGGLFWMRGEQAGVEFLTGYLIEKSLSVDNIFVIVLIFTYFAVPAQYQHRVLFWGILGALVMRGTFIGVGTYILHAWHPVIYVFGALLVVTGIRLVFKHEETPDLNSNVIVRLTRRIVHITPKYHGQHFTVVEAGRRVATPLLLVLVMIEASDVIFALDSIPAIFAITDDPFIVYTSNVFAVLGLRSMYFMLGDVVHRFVYIKYGLAAVLVFIGTKMLIADLYKMPVLTSLAFVAGAISLSIVASIVHSAPPAPEEIAAQPVMQLWRRTGTD
jgi:tellurite resistance protein TerC